jgi:hypothetical protein
MPTCRAAAGATFGAMLYHPLLSDPCRVTFGFQPSLFNVRALRLILTAIFAVVAVTAGLVVAAVVAVVGFAVYLAARLFGPRRVGTATRRPFRSSPRTDSVGDAIEVTATEVDVQSTPSEERAVTNDRLRE